MIRGLISVVMSVLITIVVGYVLTLLVSLVPLPGGVENVLTTIIWIIVGLICVVTLVRYLTTFLPANTP